MYESKKKNYAHMGASLCKTLEKRGFKAQYAATAEDAKNIIAALIEDGASVGVPGTVTVRQIGLMEALAAKGCKVVHHWDPALTREARLKVLMDEMNTDWYVTSSNAVSMDGSLVNIDGTGNRVAVMSWALGKIIYVIGVNKITGDLESAMDRARNIASPANAIRTGAQTPCTKLGHCIDCDSPGRICNVFTIIERCPIGRECHVIVVGEDLGY
ncbi:lactate utilization protein [Synergistaceae bacterium OttesenSCG-928-D05]|nr:lactate utilization protein [Synergistaceae bacterium OttesenSCG-928-D05]